MKWADFKASGSYQRHLEAKIVELDDSVATYKRQRDHWRSLYHGAMKMDDMEEKRGRLDKASEERERAKKLHDVFREIVSLANLSRSDMLRMMESFPGIDPSHIEYVATAPDPDFRSGFEDVLLLSLASIW
jgi:hypothetical protein